MEIFSHSSKINRDQVGLLILSEHLNRIRNNFLHLDYKEELNSPVIPSYVETYSGELGLCAYEVFLGGNVPVSDTSLSSDVSNLLYGGSDGDIRLDFYPSDENNTIFLGSGDLGNGERRDTYKVLFRLEGEGGTTSYHSVVSVDPLFQRVCGILVQSQWLEEELIRSKTVVIIEDVRLNVRSFEEHVFTDYSRYFRIDSGELKDKENYEIIDIEEKSKEGLSNRKKIEFFQFRSYSMLGGSCNLLEWRDSDGFLKTLTAPYSYEFYALLRDRRTQHIFPVFRLPSGINLFSSLLPWDVSSEEVSELPTDSTSSFSNVYAAVNIMDTSNIVTKVIRPEVLEINSWSDVAKYENPNSDKVHAIIKTVKKRRGESHYLPLLLDKHDASVVEHFHFSVAGPLSGRFDFNSLSTCSSGLNIYDCPFHFSLGISPSPPTYEAQCIFSAFSPDMRSSMILYVLPDMRLLFSISINGLHTAVCSKVGLGLYKFNLLTFNVGSANGKDWSMYLNGSSVALQWLQGDLKERNLSNITDFIFCGIPDPREHNLVSALESGFYSPGNFRLVNFILSPGYENWEKHRNAYKYGVKDYSLKDDRNLIHLEWNDWNHSNNSIYCLATGHQLLVKNS
jgi:hypothetical protein